MDVTVRKMVAVTASKLIGKLLLANFGKKFAVQEKGDRDLVTDIDKKADEIFATSIKKQFPEDDILSEESGFSPSGAAYRWIIDPIDGTHNFIHNIEIFGTSIALEFKGKVILGLIYLPCQDQLYLAETGKGSYCNGKQISVSKRHLNQATMVYDSSLRLNKEPMLKGLNRLIDRVFNVRMFGSTVYSLSYLAQGKVDIEIEFNDKLWDFAAGLLLVEEAGGMVSDLQGRPWSTATTGYIAANALVHSDVLKIVKG